MGFYSRYIFPQLLDWAMADPVFGRLRRELLADVRGEVLEIGFGTGLNLAYYPESVTKITTVDPNRGMNRLAKRRIQSSSKIVDIKNISGEALPMPNQSFDSVVSTWTLCSIVNLDKALAEIYRVLRPGGGLFFLEHGLSNEPEVQVWQDRLTPIQKLLGDGCHLNRPIAKYLSTHFEQLEIKNFYLEGVPKISGYMYCGLATKVG